jgi:hypothetical protein
MWGKWSADGIPHADMAYNSYNAYLAYNADQIPQSAHLYYENCPSATVFCGVVFPGAICTPPETNKSIVNKKNENWLKLSSF